MLRVGRPIVVRGSVNAFVRRRRRGHINSSSSYLTYPTTMALNPTNANDHTVNKVAVCSAIIAGFAYVGYSVAKNAFGRRHGRKNDDGERFDDTFPGQNTAVLPCSSSLKIGIKRKWCREGVGATRLSIANIKDTGL